MTALAAAALIVAVLALVVAVTADRRASRVLDAAVAQILAGRRAR